MNKKYIILTFVMVLIYGIISFINWNINPQYWGWFSRLALVIWWYVVYLKSDDYE